MDGPGIQPAADTSAPPSMIVAMRWACLPPLLLVPVLITCRSGVTPVIGEFNLALLVAWCVVMWASSRRIWRLSSGRSRSWWLMSAHLFVNAALLVHCEDVFGIQDALGVVVLGAFTLAALMWAVAATKRLSAGFSWPRLLGLLLGIPAGLIAVLHLSFVASKGFFPPQLSMTVSIDGGRRELCIYDETCLPPDSLCECDDRRVTIYVRHRTLPIVLFKETLPATTLLGGGVAEQDGRVSISFGCDEPVRVLDLRSYALITPDRSR